MLTIIINLWDTTNSKNNLFLSACEKGNIIVCNYLINKFNNIDIHTKNYCTFRYSCAYGHLNIAKRLVYLGFQKKFTPVDIHAVHEFAFRYCCDNGHLDVAKWLVNLGLQNFTPINVHIFDYAFRGSCRHGHMEVAKWLINFTSVNIHANNEYAFRWSCKNDNLEIAKWLVDLGVEILYSFKQ